MIKIIKDFVKLVNSKLEEFGKNYQNWKKNTNNLFLIFLSDFAIISSILLLGCLFIFTATIGGMIILYYPIQLVTAMFAWTFGHPGITALILMFGMIILVFINDLKTKKVI